MTATIDQLIDQHSGRGLSQESGVSTVEDLFNAAYADVTDLRTKLVVVATMLDAEGTLGGGYVTAATPATQQLLKGT